MRTLSVLSLAAALAVASSAAFGFQEQKSAAPAVAPQAPAAAKSLGVSEQTAVKPATGTEVRIPGLGKLGVLPKMDFGLELLYGAAESKPTEPATREINPTDDDLTIRGTVKHRF